MLLFSLTQRKYDSILRHVLKHGMAPRVHKNVGNNFRCFSYSKYKEDRVVERAQAFLTNYGNIYGMPDPGN